MLQALEQQFSQHLSMLNDLKARDEQLRTDLQSIAVEIYEAKERAEAYALFLDAIIPNSDTPRMLLL